MCDTPRPVPISTGQKLLTYDRKLGARFVAGLGVMVLLSRVSPARLRIWTPFVFAVTLALLPMVFAFGSGRSARLWINLGVFYLQPGELLKLSVPMMLAWYLHAAVLPPRWGTLRGPLLLGLLDRPRRCSVGRGERHGEHEVQLLLGRERPGVEERLGPGSFDEIAGGRVEFDVGHIRSRGNQRPAEPSQVNRNQVEQGPQGHRHEHHEQSGK